MRKKFTYIITLLICLGFGEMSSQSFKMRTCDSGNDRAKKDIIKGIYKSLSYGLIFDQNPEFNQFYTNFIHKKYGIILGNAGCVVTADSKCYSATMKRAIFEKFGENIFEKAKIEATTSFKLTDFYIKNIKAKIDANEPFGGYVQNEPELVTGSDSYRGFRRDLNIEFKNSPELKNISGRVKLGYTIEKDGSISNIEISESLSDKADDRAIQLLKTLPKFIPGSHYGEIVRVKRAFYFQKE